jgi:hypothetical protein
MPVSPRTANANTSATRLGCGMCVADGDVLLSDVATNCIDYVPISTKVSSP